jgi:hypothetical protein
MGVRTTPYLLIMSGSDGIDLNTLLMVAINPRVLFVVSLLVATSLTGSAVLSEAIENFRIQGNEFGFLKRSCDNKKIKNRAIRKITIQI